MQNGRFVPSSAVLSARGLTYRHADGVLLFDSLSVSLSAVRTGLVGVNGSGKTTLVEILAGVRGASAGSVVSSGSVAFLPQREEIEARATVADLMGIGSVIEAIARVQGGVSSASDLEIIGDAWEMPQRARAALDSIELDRVGLDRSASSLSGGERTRARLAGCLLAGPDVLILDEPTNHLDRAGRKALLTWMSSWRGTILVASHDRELLGECDEIWALGARGIRIYGGNYDFYREAREKEVAAVERATANARSELDRAREELAAVNERQQKRAERGRKASIKANEPKIFRGRQKERAESTLARGARVHEDRVTRAESKWVAARSEGLAPIELRIDFASEGGDRRTLVDARQLNLKLPNGAVLWEKPTTFALRRGDRAALVGANGSGKTALLRTIGMSVFERLGALEVRTDRIGYLDQFLANLVNDQTLLENLLRAEPKLGETEARIRLGRLGFAQAQALKRAGALSGGERVRLSLGCLFAPTPSPELLLLDEPTNHLDLESLEVVEATLRKYPGAILVASHDQRFLEALGVDSTLSLTRNPQKVPGTL